MLTDCVRILADWLAHPTHGMAAGLAAVPLDGDVVRVSTVTLFDETRHEEAGRLQAPETLPALVVNTAGTIAQGVVAVRPFPADNQAEAVLRHIVREGDTEDGLAALVQGQRAITWSLRRLFSSTIAGTEAARSRNQIQLYSIRSYRAELYRGNEDSILTMAHTLTLDVRDTWAAL